jgi:hypothetical protein
MIKLAVNNILGFAIQPNCKNTAGIVNTIGTQSNIAFIDLAASNEIMKFISTLENAQHRIVWFGDHHLDPRNKCEKANTETLYSKLEKNAIILPRRNAISCINLLKPGKWVNENIDIVFFHADFDGFLAYIKGCGITYENMESDADILDGGKTAQNQELTEIGKTLADACGNLVPRFCKDPTGHHKTKEYVFQTIADYFLKQETTEKAYLTLKAKTDEATQTANRNAMQLLNDTVIILGEIAYADMTPYIISQEPLAIPVWKVNVLKKLKPTLLASIGYGHMGKQVFLELPKNVRNIDLRDFLPRGVRGHVRFRAQVPYDRWPEFLKNWKK